MKEIILNVKGIECSGCENRIQNAVKSIEKVKNVTASHINGTVTVDVEEDANINEIKDTIENIGFEVEE